MIDAKREELYGELNLLRNNYYLTDKSEENIKRGERIRELLKELDIKPKTRKNRTPPRAINR